MKVLAVADGSTARAKSGAGVTATATKPAAKARREIGELIEQPFRPVPRTRSSHDFAAGTVANFGFKSGTRIIELLVSSRSRSSLRGHGKCWRTSESGH